MKTLKMKDAIAEDRGSCAETTKRPIWAYFGFAVGADG